MVDTMVIMEKLLVAVVLLAYTRASEALYCPGYCRLDHSEDCLHNGHICSSSDFCSLILDHGTTLHGLCSSQNSLSNCLQHKKECAVDTSADQTPFQHFESRCQWSCCLTDDCIQSRLSIYSTTGRTTTPTPTTQPSTATTTTVQTTTPLSLFNRFNGSCQDQMEAGVCEVLKETQDVCHNHLSIDLCPDTCGICQAIKQANCHDTVLNDGCKDLAANKNHCDDSLSEITCPVTCGHCDKIINKLLQSINAQETTTPSA